MKFENCIFDRLNVVDYLSVRSSLRVGNIGKLKLYGILRQQIFVMYSFIELVTNIINLIGQLIVRVLCFTAGNDNGLNCPAANTRKSIQQFGILSFKLCNGIFELFCRTEIYYFLFNFGKGIDVRRRLFCLFRHFRNIGDFGNLRCSALGNSR